MVSFAVVEILVKLNLANSKLPVGKVTPGGTARTIVARPVELALVLEVLSTTVLITEVVVISLDRFTLVLSKVKTTLAKEMLLVLALIIILKVESGGRVWLEGEKDISTGSTTAWVLYVTLWRSKAIAIGKERTIAKIPTSLRVFPLR